MRQSPGAEYCHARGREIIPDPHKGPGARRKRPATRCSAAPRSGERSAKTKEPRAACQPGQIAVRICSSVLLRQPQLDGQHPRWEAPDDRSAVQSGQRCCRAAGLSAQRDVPEVRSLGRAGASGTGGGQRRGAARDRAHLTGGRRDARRFGRRRGRRADYRAIAGLGVGLTATPSASGVPAGAVGVVALAGDAAARRRALGRPPGRRRPGPTTAGRSPPGHPPRLRRARTGAVTASSLAPRASDGLGVSPPDSAGASDAVAAPVTVPAAVVGADDQVPSADASGSSGTRDGKPTGAASTSSNGISA